ncbi:MAG: hypothetical protein LQ346_005056 [Caloplaca aetnensis]|nr:MAG: hypothetical protein LQ346_005056 [Caloplaca aetnensis]
MRPLLSLTFTFLSLLYLAPHVALAALGSGSASLWSDSGCGDGGTLAFTTPVIIALNYTLPADVCRSLDRTAHSYRIDYRPICTQGNDATFAYFSGQNCDEGSSDDGAGPAYSGSLGPEPILDGQAVDGLCFALVSFNSFAFVCEGVGKGDGSTTSAIAGQTSSSATSAASTAVQATLGATPIAPGTSLTSPLYTAPGTVVLPIGGAATASGGPLPTAGLAPPPAPSPFTGAATRFQASLVGLFAVNVAGLVL